jgi:V/A-type H+-transporting ATPase subunit I
MIVDMDKLSIIGLKNDFSRFVRFLRTVKLLHIQKTQTSQNLFASDPKLLKTRRRTEELQSRIEEVLNKLPPISELSKSSTISLKSQFQYTDIEELLIHTEELLKEIEDKLDTIQLRKDEIDRKIEYLALYQKALGLQDFTNIEDPEKVEIFVLLLKEHEVTRLETLEDDIAELSFGIYDIVTKRSSDDIIVVYFIIGKEFISDVKNFLFHQKISELTIPEELKQIGLEEPEQSIEKIAQDNEIEQKHLAEDLTELTEKYRSQLTMLLAYFQQEEENFNLTDYVEGTVDTWEITGFLPRDEWDLFHTKIKEEFGNRVFVHKDEAGKDAPIKKKNNRLVMPFEVLSNLVQPPRYGSSDPTIILFFMFPLFWGFIVGDIGYSLLIGFTCIALRQYSIRKGNKTNQYIMEVFIISSLAGVFWGFIFGEFFGDLGSFILVPIIDRYTDIEVLLLLSIGLGYTIVIVGSLYGGYNSLKFDQKSNAISSVVVALMWLSLSLVFFGTIVFPSIAELIIALEIIFLVVGLGILLVKNGVASIINLETKLPNILSFARLMAIGLSGTWLSFIANLFIFDYFPLGLIIGGLLHIINIVLLFLTPTIHSIRLNLYETFEQFYIRTDTNYKPFGI